MPLQVIGRRYGVMRYIAVFFITLYQRMVSPLFPPACRFVPTCSQYAKEAFQKYGFFKGFWLALKRISKCHPFHPGGYDPLL